MFPEAFPFWNFDLVSIGAQDSKVQQRILSFFPEALSRDLQNLVASTQWHPHVTSVAKLPRKAHSRARGGQGQPSRACLVLLLKISECAPFLGIYFIIQDDLNGTYLLSAGCRRRRCFAKWKLPGRHPVERAVTLA